MSCSKFLENIPMVIQNQFNVLFYTLNKIFVREVFRRRNELQVYYKGSFHFKKILFVINKVAYLHCNL